jgi:predicted SprT family Zn-dependent metalloprotease
LPRKLLQITEAILIGMMEIDPKDKRASQLPSHMTEDCEHFCALWCIEHVLNDLSVSFSTRMTRSLGRTNVRTRTIRLNARLTSSPILTDVLCHELAHIADYELHGPDRPPHSDEWRQLVVTAGYVPRLKMPMDLIGSRSPSTRTYVHRCVVCGAERTAKRRMNRWRCGECRANGLPGELEILEL